MYGEHIVKSFLGLLLTGLLVSPGSGASPKTDSYASARDRMVDEDIAGAGVKNPRVISAMRSTPRHEFVSAASRQAAYDDMALPIGESQTISPPFIVAYMTEQLDPQPEDKVLEIGTGSGYQAAVLSPLVKEVYSIEIVKPLGERAASTLKRLGYKNVFTRIGDGYQGWPEVAPFDKIIVTCSPEKVPPKLIEQLREGGSMVVPVGERYRQTLYLFAKEKGKLKSVALQPILFVPMTGTAESQREHKPDPVNPRVENGSFEELVAGGRSVNLVSPRQAAAWHYQRQMKLMVADEAPDGKSFARFTNSMPGRISMALQGMAIDGRKVHFVEASLWVQADRVQQGLREGELASLSIVFYDENRAEVGSTWLGPWSGSFDWKKVSEKLDVPPRAREAILRLGLHGAVGEISFDAIELHAVKK